MASGGSAASVHATGLPDTPIEVLEDILSKATKEENVEQLKALVQRAHKLVAGLDPYLETISTPPSEVCQQLIEKSLQNDWQGVFDKGQSQFLQKKECCAGALEGRLISTLCRLTAAKTVLEVGMFTGTTTLAVAEALPDDGKVYALEIESYMRDFATPFLERAGVQDKVHIEVGPANEGMKRLADQGVRWDLAFIDADKTGYLGYYNQLMDNNLILPGGAIVVDNSLMKGRVYEPDGVKDEMADAIREFNKVVAADPRVDVIALPFRDGVNIIMRKQVKKGDEVEQGVGGNSIAQRLKLNSRVALVTGAGQGIGRAYAHALGEAGAAVAVVDIQEIKAEEVCEELTRKGVRCIAIKADVTDAKECDRMVTMVVERLGRLDIAVNNAGMNRNHAAEDCSEDDWDRTFQLNTKGVFLCAQAEGRHMLKHGGGRIINTASMAAVFVPHPQKQIAYNASKAAVVKITETLGVEWADRNVRVNCISPGIVNTALIQESETLKPLVSEWLTQIPMNRLALLTDLQGAILYLASDASGYMTGQNLIIDGGHTTW